MIQKKLRIIFYLNNRRLSCLQFLIILLLPMCVALSATAIAGIGAPSNLYIQSNTTDGDTTFTDLSGAGHLITANGHVQHGDSARFGNNTAICLDGTGDYLSVPNSTDWDFGTGNFTIDLWVNFAAVPASYDGILSTWNAGTNTGYMFCVFNGTINWYHFNTGWLDTGITPVPGQWYHLAAVQCCDTLKIYVDGSETASKGCAGLAIDSAGDGLRIGRLYSTRAGYDMQGHVDEITVTKGTALWTGNFSPPNYPSIPDQDYDQDGIIDTDETGYGTDPTKADTDGDGITDYDEIFTYFTNPLKADTDGDGFNDGYEIDVSGTDPTDASSRPSEMAGATKLYIHSDDTADGRTTFEDSSQAGHTITGNGNARHAGSALFDGTTAVYFDGTGDYLSTANSADWDFGAGDFTIDLWVNFASAPNSYDGILSTWNVSKNMGYMFCILNGTINWYHYNTGWLNTGIIPTPGLWYQLTAVRFGNTLKIYVNGIERASKACPGALITSAGEGLRIGRLYSTRTGYDMHGYVDEITVTKGFAKWINNFSSFVNFTILQTSDVHDHASGYGPYLDYTPLTTTDTENTWGGYSRLAYAIGSIRATAGNPVVLVDSGDFLMGAAYDMTFTDPIAFRFFASMGYDAITFGNHEFDWTPNGLAGFLNNAMSASGAVLPVFNPATTAIVATNTITDGVGGTGDDAIEAYKSAGVIKSKHIITLPGGVTVGLLGLNGASSDTDSPAKSPITFNHNTAFIQAAVDDLTNNDGVDLVMILSHSGIENDGSGEDAVLAAAVSGIDFIASGHAHTATSPEKMVGNTIIFSPGEYGDHLSRLSVSYLPAKDLVVGHTFNLVNIDENMPGSAAMQGMVTGYNAVINAGLAPLGESLSSKVIKTSFSLQKGSFAENSLGCLTADALRGWANMTEILAGRAPTYTIGVIGTGTIRDPLIPAVSAGDVNDVSFSDVYNCLPLGMSLFDQSVPGYPQLSIYATGQDIWTMCVMGLHISQVLGMPEFYLNFSGLQINFNPLLPPVGYFSISSVSYYAPNDFFCMGPAGGQPALTPIANDPNPLTPGNLYRVSVGLYELLMMQNVNATVLPAFGYPPIVPRDAAGNPVALSPALTMDADGNAGNGLQELKQWMALDFYLRNIVAANPIVPGAIPQMIYDPSFGVVPFNISNRILP